AQTRSIQSLPSTPCSDRYRQLSCRTAVRCRYSSVIIEYASAACHTEQVALPRSDHVVANDCWYSAAADPGGEGAWCCSPSMCVMPFDRMTPSKDIRLISFFPGATSLG